MFATDKMLGLLKLLAFFVVATLLICTGLRFAHDEMLGLLTSLMFLVVAAMSIRSSLKIVRHMIQRLKSPDQMAEYVSRHGKRSVYFSVIIHIVALAMFLGFGIATGVLGMITFYNTILR